MSGALRGAARALAVTLLALATALSARAQDADTSTVQSAAREWLAVTDTLDGGKSWRMAGTKFRAAISVEKWTEALGKVREPLGAVEQRTAESTKLAKSLPGVPDGEYATIEFRTAFEKKREAAEIVRLERESDGAWHVIGYFIR